MATSRTRNYACVVYPESAPENWQDILQEMFVPAFISPLHDRDVNPTGEPKKSHWHIIIMFDSVKTREQAKEIFDHIGGVGCEIVNSIRGYARYLCHLDNPEKVQYDKKEVKSLCGADYFNVIGIASDKYEVIGAMLTYCKENKVYSYSDFLLYCYAERYDWFRALCDYASYVVKGFLQSSFWTDSNQL